MDIEALDAWLEKLKPAANPIFVRLTSFKTRKVRADGVVQFGQFPETLDRAVAG